MDKEETSIVAMLNESDYLNMNGPPRKRRMKNPLPETAKDEEYWLKRMKNNISAKRSRDNKRQMDNMMRSRVGQLEAENAMLKRELWALKKKFGLEPNTTVIDDDDDVGRLSDIVQGQSNGMCLQGSPPRSAYPPSSQTPRSQNGKSLMQDSNSVMQHPSETGAHADTEDVIITQFECKKTVAGKTVRKSGSGFLSDALRCMKARNVTDQYSSQSGRCDDPEMVMLDDRVAYNDEPTDLSTHASSSRETSAEDISESGVYIEERNKNALRLGVNNYEPRTNVNRHKRSRDKPEERSVVPSKDILEELTSLSEQLKQMQKLVCNQMSSS